MEIEEVYINLKVLENLNKNQKLISRGPYLNIEPNSIIPEAIRRWHRQDSRDEMLKKINLVVNTAIDYILQKRQIAQAMETHNTSLNTMRQHTGIRSQLSEMSNEKNLLFGTEQHKEGHDMHIYLENALYGIKNLKETYATCSQTCARLDVIINKINHLLGITGKPSSQSIQNKIFNQPSASEVTIDATKQANQSQSPYEREYTSSTETVQGSHDAELVV